MPSSLSCCYTIALVVLGVLLVPEAPLAAQGAQDLGGRLFIDARQTSFTRDMRHQNLEGDVVVIGVGSIIAADKVSFDRVTRVVTAEGHFIILNKNQIFLGDSVVYHLDSGDLKMTNATMIMNDKKGADEARNRILGFTAKELSFEAERRERLSEIAAQKTTVLAELHRQGARSLDIPPELIERYALLLEREELIKKQGNPALMRMDAERREAVQRRRYYWEEARTQALSLNKEVMPEAYFKIKGEVIERLNGNDYFAREALITPCYCREDEAPAWGFRTDYLEAQPGGYADLYHPVLEIKGIPVLYLPYLKLPLKSQRQSGFLMPVVGYESESGQIYSQPVFFDFSPSTDATLTTDFYQKRGARLGVEFRHQQTEYSGWQFRVETIRDYMWLRERALRGELVDTYQEGLTAAMQTLETQGPAALEGSIGEKQEAENERDYLRRVARDPRYWQKVLQEKAGARPLTLEDRPVLESEINRRLSVPKNAWRGSYAWRGATFLAPRLSIVSHGEVNSDHRYSEDLYVPDDFQEAFFGGRDVGALSAARAQIHLDGKDLYAGVGTSYGDYYLTEQRFEGQQLPLRFKLQSRMFSLLPSSWRRVPPVMAQIQGEHLRISESKGPASDEKVTLGAGYWRRAKLSVVSPLITDSIIKVSHFTELEARYMAHAGLDQPTSSIRSWRTGLEFSLPIDGQGELPEFMQKTSDFKHVQNGTLYGHHFMDWRLRLSLRPSVVKRGDYTNPQATGGDLTYFASDRAPQNSDVDRDVPDEERMKQHQRLTFSTNHAWRLLSRTWNLQTDDAAVARQDTPPEDSRVRARRELLLALRRPDALDGTPGLRKADQYLATPMTLKAEVSYDFLDARERRLQKEQHREIDSEIAESRGRVAALEQQIAAETALPARDETRLAALRAAQQAEQQKINTALAQKTPLAEPWKDPTFEGSIAYAGGSLISHVRYSVYAKTAREAGFSLNLPTFLQTNVALGYTQTKEIDLLKQSFTRTRERSINIATSLIPPVTTYISLKRRVIDEQVQSYSSSVRTAFGFDYQSPSRCWGLQFSREKEYDLDEREAKYMLRLSVIFMGQERKLPNMSPAVVRDLKGSEQENK